MDAPDRPRTAFRLSLGGLVVHILVFALVLSFALLFAGAPFGDVLEPPLAPLSSQLGVFLLWLATGVVLLVIATAGTALLNAPSPSQVRTGGILVLLSAVLAFPTLWGLFLGSLLMFLGGILALTWEPTPTA